MHNFLINVGVLKYCVNIQIGLDSLTECTDTAYCDSVLIYMEVTSYALTFYKILLK